MCNSQPDESESRNRVEIPDGLVVFDGRCNFCASQVQLLLRLDRDAKLYFTSIHSEFGQWLAKQFGIDIEDPSSILFFDKGYPLKDSDALVGVLSRLPWPLRAGTIVRVVPRQIRDMLYRFIARRRYSLAGRRETCMIPSAEMATRFIDELPIRE